MVEGVDVYLQVSTLPTRQVLVYPDRAEVKRLVQQDLGQGMTALHIQGLSSVIERESVRIEGLSTARILDVQYEECPNHQKSQSTKELDELEAVKNDLDGQRTSLEDEVQNLKKRLDVLDGVATQVGQFPLENNTSAESVCEEQEPKPQTRLSPFLLYNEATTNLAKFLDYYDKSAGQIRKELRMKESKIVSLKSELSETERRIDQLRCRVEYDNNNRSLLLNLEMEQPGRAELFLIYQVYCASWKPSYDIRACTSSGADDPEQEEQQASLPNAVQVVYYGQVEQRTEEDWLDAELILSTSTPCIGGSAPILPTTTVTLQKYATRPRLYGSYRKPMSNASDEDVGIGSFDYNDYTDAIALQRMALAKSNSDMEIAQNGDQLPVVCFSIDGHESIKCDGNPQRVRIARFDLAAVFVHESVPSRSPSAFISAFLTNSTSLPFLPGQVSVFLNNSFICTQPLKTVLPNGEFHCVFGVDPSVKIEYKPHERMNEQIGFMSKSTLTTHQQFIVLRNAKVNEKVQVTVREPVPRSLDEKIKICVISPELRSNRSEARLSKDHHLEWVCELGPGEQKELKDFTDNLVTVFHGRAEVKQCLKVDLKAGVNRVVITSLPESVDGHTIRVSAPNGFNIHEIQTQHPRVCESVEKLRSDENNPTTEDPNGANTQRDVINSSRIDVNRKRSIRIVIEATADEKADMELSYQVTNVLWTPSYDIRLETGAEPKLQFFYFADIKQCSGVDWRDVELKLSTAQVGTVQQPYSTDRLDQDHNKSSLSARERPPITYPSLPTCFTLQRHMTVESGSTTHKVTIAGLKLDSTIQYECVPGLSNQVYLVANIINTSSYPILQGCAALYMNNNLCTNVSLPEVGPGERFKCRLGADSSLKVSSGPLFRSHQYSGMLSRHHEVVFEKKVILKNQKRDDSVVINVIEYLPEAKGKVTILSPDLRATNSTMAKSEQGAKTNGGNQIEWTVGLGPLESKEVVFKFGIVQPVEPNP